MRSAKQRPHLGDLESRVLDVLWDADTDLLVRDVLERLPGRELAYTTVLTILDRLHRKKFVRRRRDGVAYRYRASFTRESYAADLLSDALNVAHDRPAALVHFIGSLTPDDAAALRAALGEGGR